MLKKLTLFAISLMVIASTPMASAQTAEIKSANKINPTTVEIRFTEGESMMLDFYGKNIFRLFQDNNGGIIRNPEAKPEAQILVDKPRREVGDIKFDLKAIDGFMVDKQLGVKQF